MEHPSIFFAAIKKSNAEGKFDEKQLKTIERTLYRCLKNKEIREKKVVLPKDNNEALDFFIAAKKIASILC